MAYLNVSDRRIEAKIAYVGPEVSGITGNFDHILKGASSARLGKVESSSLAGMDTLSVAWRPSNGEGFRDCDVLARVFSPRANEEVTFEESLDEADGVVLIVDAHPDSADKNRASWQALRLALAHRADIPVVFQVNRTDPVLARSADEVVAELDASDHRHVAAFAMFGEGVIETLEAALEEVLRRMKSDAVAAEVVAEVEPTASRKPTGHPLLDALRDVLRDAIIEQADRLEARVTDKISAELGVVAERMQGIGARVDALQDQIGAIQDQVGALQAQLGAVQGQVGVLETRVSIPPEAPTIVPVADPEASVLMAERLLRTKEEVVLEMTRLFDARAEAEKADREAANLSIKKCLYGLSIELKTIDARARVSEVAENVGQLVENASTMSVKTAALGERTEGLAARTGELAEQSSTLAKRTSELAESNRAAITALDKMSRRLDGMDSATSKRIGMVEEIVLALRSEVLETLASTDQKVDQAHGRVGELIEELKRPKKGWFT